MNAFDGRTVVEGFFGDDFYVMIWDATVGNVVVSRNGEHVSLITYTDEDGRPAFQATLGNDLVGWLDTSGGELHVHIAHSTSGAGLWWLGEIVVSDGAADQTGVVLISTPVAATRKKCVCKGSLQLCDGSEDCQGGQSCTLPNGGGNSRCVFAHAPVDQEPADCGDVVFAQAPLGMAVFAFLVGPYRRSRVRLRARGA